MGLGQIGLFNPLKTNVLQSGLFFKKPDGPSKIIPARRKQCPFSLFELEIYCFSRISFIALVSIPFLLSLRDSILSLQQCQLLSLHHDGHHCRSGSGVARDFSKIDIGEGDLSRLAPRPLSISGFRHRLGVMNSTSLLFSSVESISPPAFFFILNSKFIFV